jgi:hypothetical protein
MATGTTNQSLDTRFVYQIGQDYFWIEVWLYNFLDNYPPIQIPFFFINQIAIEETLNDWNVKGYIVLENDYEILERGAPAYVGKSSNTGNTGAYKAPYLFRTDGRNRISIKIFPYKNQQNDVSETLPLSEWQMNFNFIIYDVQDLSLNEPGKKLRAYYFKDEKHQILQERNIEWSTSSSAPVGAKDEDRTMFGAQAIKSIISTASKINGKPLKVGYTSKGSISKPDIDLDVFNDKAWAPDPTDPGAKIFYTSPGTSCVLQDLNYLINQTKSSDNSPVLLQYARNEYDQGWKLIPLSMFFKLSQKNQVERLVINDGVDSTNFPPSIPRADTSVTSAIRNFTSGTASMILNYHYSPMVATDDNLLCNSPLFNYDFKNGKYNAYFEKNSVTNLLNSASKMVQNGLFNFSQANQNGQIQLNINPTKASGIMTKNYFLPQQFFLKDYPLMNMLKDLVFLAGAVYFQVPGLTIRSPGKFVYIDKLGAGDKNGFDDRFLGQWMITKVTHFFTKGSYINDVVATKIDSYSKLFPDPKNDKSY